MDISKYKNIVKNIKNSLIIDFSSNGSVFVFVLAVNKDGKKNHIQTIRFDSGVSISAGVYDAYNDCFYVKCEDYVFLDSIPFVVTCSVEDNQNWKYKVPFSKIALNKLMNKDQKKVLRRFIKKYPANDYNIEFMQLYNSRCK